MNSVVTATSFVRRRTESEGRLSGLAGAPVHILINPLSRPIGSGINDSWVREQKYDRQMVFFIMRVGRFWQWNLVYVAWTRPSPARPPAHSERARPFARYGVLPVLLCAILGLLVFFQDPGDLGGRIGVIVTVFLAMTAIQFVLNDSTPQSTYIQPLQQVRPTRPRAHAPTRPRAHALTVALAR